MRALVVNRTQDAAAFTSLEEHLDEAFLDAASPSDGVEVDVAFSSLNYKDALALSGRPGIIRAQRLIPGIDLVGTVAAASPSMNSGNSLAESIEAGTRAGSSPSMNSGNSTRVLVNGCGIGETHNGGLATRARVDREWLVPVPDTMSLEQAAAIGTAGYTAMLAVLALERAGVWGDVLVTGAGGGVGSIAVALLSRLGFRVAASTGRSETHDYLRSLGATTIVDRAEFATPGKALQEQRWDGVVESVGGATLSNVLSQVRYGGTVAAIGNAQSAEFTSSVYPFILRAVTLTGINSVYTPRELRLEAWDRLGTDLDLGLLDSMTSVIGLGDAVEHASSILEGSVRGRTVVDVRS